MAFHIKDGYVENGGPNYFLDSVTQEAGIVFQPDVYAMAELLAELGDVRTLVDLGCGRGDKLAAIHARHPDWRIVGVDHGPNIKYCSSNYTWGRWLRLSLEKVQDIPKGAVVVCADVIEHVVDPSPLLETLRSSAARVVVLSTPERDWEYGVEHMGPPPNGHHVREWNATELRALLEDAGLTVRFVGLTRSHDQGGTPHMATTIAICN